MLHVILQILAVIGIILLCILGLFLLLLALILFVPVRYRIAGTKNEKEMQLSVKITYLLHMLSASYRYPEPGRLIVRLFGIKVYGAKKEDDGMRSRKAGTAEEESDVPEQTVKEPRYQEDAPKQTAKEPQDKEDASEQIAEEPQDKGDAPKQIAEKPREISGIPEKKVSSKEDSFLRHPIKWLKAKIEKIRYTFRIICDKIKKIAENISYYRDILTKKENKLLFDRAKTRAIKVLKSIRPRVLKADICVGTGSPDTTGYVCALYGMLLPVLGNNVRINADFEKAILEGRFLMKGRITVFTILLQAGKIYFDKQLRIFIKELKREE